MVGYRVAVVGASGNVGREALSILDERRFPIAEIHALASSRSAGKEVSFGEKDILKIKDLAKFDFSNTDIVLSSPGAKVSCEFAPKAAAAGAIVIDNTSHFRMDPDVPLVIPEVNGEALNSIPKGIVANPNCSTIQMLVALKPLHDVWTIKRIVVSTYQSTSGKGKDAMDELFSQTRGVFMHDSLEKKVFPKQIAFNVLPHVDVSMDDGKTKEEWKMKVETQKILDPSIRVNAHCARVPVFIGHGMFVNIECEGSISAEAAREALYGAPGVAVVNPDEGEGYITPAESAGDDDVFVSRLRDDDSCENSISFWCAADNIRKGAALNTVQIAEELIARRIVAEP